MNIENMLKNFYYKRKNGATKEEILELEKNYHWILPDFYKEILNFSNGLELDNEETFIFLFNTSYMLKANKKIYETTIFAPNLLVIGNTGGDEILVVEQKKDSEKIYIYDPGALFPGEEDITIIHIEKWFLNGCPMGEELYKCTY